VGADAAGPSVHDRFTDAPGDGKPKLTSGTYNRGVTRTDTELGNDSVRSATAAALRDTAPAVTELGLALRELRAALPPDLRADAERVFMNAFGNAVWAAGHAGD
jgi:hypothetical protein